MKEALRPGLSAPQYKQLAGTISFVVGQSPGLVMPKHPLPGHPPIPPQLRPDRPVITDPRPTWHYHGPDPAPGEWPVYPPEAGKCAGKGLIPVRLISGLMRENVGAVEGPDGQTLRVYARLKGAPKYGYVVGAKEVERHINRKKGEQYDPATGEGDHRGVNPDFVHKHAAHKAKYALFGDNKRIDVHPWVPAMLGKAKRVLFVIEGTLKNDSCVSAGEAVISVPSVTLWNPKEVIAAVRWIRRINPTAPFVVVPDADGIFNDQVRQQALLLRSWIRRHEGQAYIAAPYAEKDLNACTCAPHSSGAGSLTRAELAGLDGPDAYLREILRRLGETNGISYVRGVCVDCGGYFKGVDDWRFADGMIDMMVVSGSEAPVDRIAAGAIERMRVPAGRKGYPMRSRAFWALEGLSLHANHEGEISLPLPMLARVMGTYSKAVVQTLGDLGGGGGAIEIRGSLETEVELHAWVDGDGEIQISRVRDWKERPLIVVQPDFRAVEPSPMLLGEITDGALTSLVWGSKGRLAPYIARSPQTP